SAIKLIDAWNCVDVAVHSYEVAESAFIVDAVSGTDNRFALSEPRNIPCKSDRRREVVVVVPVDVRTDFRMSRVLSDELHLCQIGTHAGIGNTRSARAVDLQEGAIIPNHPSCQSVVFIGLTIPFPVDAEIQCEVGTEFPVILKISTHFALVVPMGVIPNGGVGNERRVRSADDAERPHESH